MIYTKTGDKGETSLASGVRVPKTDARIEAYGTVDELNCYIGKLRVSYGSLELLWIQNKLFNLGALLSDAPGEWITERDVKQLEAWIDELQAQLPVLHAFVLPAGNILACNCHICRTVCRRAERRMIEANADSTALCFINWLSDYLFVLSRYLNCHFKMEEETWNKDLNV